MEQLGFWHNLQDVLRIVTQFLADWLTLAIQHHGKQDLPS